AVTRDMTLGDIVFWRDCQSTRGELSEAAVPVSLDGVDLVPGLLRVGNQISFVMAAPPAPPAGPPAPPGSPGQGRLFEEVGPFRIVSVGDQVRRPGPDVKEAPGSAPTT